MTYKKRDNKPQVSNTKVYIDEVHANTPHTEYGVFARKIINKGDVIFVAKGTTVRLKIQSKRDSEKYPNALGQRRNEWLDPFPHNALRYLNHSCDPNAGVRGHVTIVALRDIKKGEQVTIDYSITECDELWDLHTNCQCGTKKCRKAIKAIQYLPKETFNRYLPNIPEPFQKEYLKANGV